MLNNSKRSPTWTRHNQHLGQSRKPPVTLSASRANKLSGRTVHTLRQARANRSLPSRLRHTNNLVSGNESALLRRLPPRCAGSRESATQRHSRSGVNCCAIQHNAADCKIAPVAYRCALAWWVNFAVWALCLTPLHGCQAISVRFGAQGISQGYGVRAKGAYSRATPVVR